MWPALLCFPPHTHSPLSCASTEHSSSPTPEMRRSKCLPLGIPNLLDHVLSEFLCPYSTSPSPVYILAGPQLCFSLFRRNIPTSIFQKLIYNICHLYISGGLIIGNPTVNIFYWSTLMSLRFFDTD